MDGLNWTQRRDDIVQFIDFNFALIGSLHRILKT
jgi:hypothetical protein